MIIITTPTGNVGSEVVRLLSTHPARLPFRVGARQPERLQQEYGSEIDCTRLDFSDPTSWQATLKGVKHLFLVCPQPDPQSIRTQMLPFIDAAIQQGCQHIIYLSVPGADRFKIIPHYQIERHIEATGIPYTFVRPGYYMQNFLRQAPTHIVDIATRHEIFIPAGKGRISMIDARDVAQAIVNICEQPEQHRMRAYTLTEARARDLREVASIFSEELGQPVRYTHPSLPRFWYRLRKRHVPWSLLLVMSIEYTMARLGKAVKTNDTTAQLIGRPPITLAQFVSDNRQRWLSFAGM